MTTAKFVSDNCPDTALNITQHENGDTVLSITGNGEFRIKAEGGKLTGIRQRIVQSLFVQTISELNKGTQVLNKGQLAEILDGRARGKEVTHEEHEIAKENGLVIVFGHSDDSMIFNGAIRGQVACWKGGTAYLDKNGLKEETNPDDSKIVRAVYAESDERIFQGKAYWTFETTIPHAKFRIYEDDICDNEQRDEDDDMWCEGIVFDISAL